MWGAAGYDPRWVVLRGPKCISRSRLHRYVETQLSSNAVSKYFILILHLPTQYPLIHCAENGSIWGLLFGPLQDWPLALMDYTSPDKARDLISLDNIYVHRIRESYNVL